jgi:diguanylate cyclase (GGDEF)-like protein
VILTVAENAARTHDASVIIAEMSENLDDSKPTVVVCVADDAARQHAEERLRCIGAVDCRVVTTSPSDSPHIAVLQLSNSEPGASATGDVDYHLPPDCSDDALRAAIDLLAKIAQLQTQLGHAHRTKDDLAALAATDPLTGLPNRRVWDDALAGSRQDVDRHQANFCVAVLDLDEFKQVNDVHGHAVGDAVLRAAADGLRHAVRRGDLAVRLGGDEFGLLLADLPPDLAAAVVERIRRSAGQAVAAAGLPATTCSAGFAKNYADADAALRRAKQTGRNRTCGG